MTIAAIGIERNIYSKLLPTEYSSTIRDISRVAIGQYAVEIMDASETYLESASITTNIAKSAINTL
jgi:hypothetical protein